MNLLNEGKASFFAYLDKKISKELPVFYNPVMKFNRDISIDILKSLDKKDLQIGLPLAASGIRGIRFLLELPQSKIKKIYFNDYSKDAIKLIKKNLKKNNLNEKFEISNLEANDFLMNSKGFDYIDIDPFGSPVSFLDQAIRRLSRKSILAVTATDTSALSGTFPKACKRKYASKPLKTVFMHEIGIRILIWKVQIIGSQFNKALVPIFSFYKDHYFRIFFRCKKGKQKADEIFNSLGYILHCDNCLNHYSSKHVFNSVECDVCGQKMDSAGELWLGNLWDQDLINNLKSIIDPKFIDLIKNESKINSVGFFHISKLNQKHKCKLIKVPKLIALLQERGFKASRTHFQGQGIRTDAGLKDVLDALG